MKILEIGTIIKYTLPKSIEISLNGNVSESEEKDITHYQIEDYRNGEYKVFNLTESEYDTLNEKFIWYCINKSKSMEIVEEELK